MVDHASATENFKILIEVQYPGVTITSSPALAQYVLIMAWYSQERTEHHVSV